MNPRDTASALYGVWLLIRFDERAFEYFDATVSGFWRSYTVAFVLAPLHALALAGSYMGRTTTPPLGRYLMIEGLEYAVLWLAFPVAMLSVSTLLERERQYLTYMVAYNWFQLAVGLVVMPWSILNTFGIIPEASGNFIDLSIFVAFMVYAAFIARGGLMIGAGAAIGLVLLDILISLFVEMTTGRML